MTDKPVTTKTLELERVDGRKFTAEVPVTMRLWDEIEDGTNSFTGRSPRLILSEMIWYKMLNTWRSDSFKGEKFASLFELDALLREALCQAKNQ